MSSKLDSLEPNFKSKVEEVISKCKEQGIELICTAGRRTIAEQNKLYAKGRTVRGDIVTKAKGGQSAHNFGLAADLCPLNQKGQAWWTAPDDIWHVMALAAKEVGLTAGYFWTMEKEGIVDKPHIQQSNWKETQALWKAGKLEVA